MSGQIAVPDILLFVVIHRESAVRVQCGSSTFREQPGANGTEVPLPQRRQESSIEVQNLSEKTAVMVHRVRALPRHAGRLEMVDFGDQEATKGGGEHGQPKELGNPCGRGIFTMRTKAARPNSSFAWNEAHREVSRMTTEEGQTFPLESRRSETLR